MAATTFTVQKQTGASELETTVEQLIIAGWAGRDAGAVEEHIRELEEIGVKRPAHTPTFYRLAPMLLSNAPVMTVTGQEATGEVEAVLIRAGGAFYVGIGSDHTDRKLETLSVTLSKQICAKPVSRDLWPLEEIEDHWDELVLSSTIEVDGKTVSYQEGPLSSLLSPRDLLDRLAQQEIDFADGSAMLCGTVPIKGEIRFAHRMQVRLEDPVLGRALVHEITLAPLPLAD
ncbi:DUF2848 domain-containing protein [Marinibacterium profundimaris]|uniref:2-keto-4-pentenoate hydratase n=1 Tax=Marinibacterium profundimaris TaxID=1679460 RepID=A0A225NCF1_9RHOB|nr:DUF2848 domain-containing protein [Marinibacterium profundimaris]OWU68339.1 hypothetical protein ATO3_24475 [Marinibacterium profundimaris]